MKTITMKGDGKRVVESGLLALLLMICAACGGDPVNEQPGSLVEPVGSDVASTIEADEEGALAESPLAEGGTAVDHTALLEVTGQETPSALPDPAVLPTEPAIEPSAPADPAVLTATSPLIGKDFATSGTFELGLMGDMIDAAIKQGGALTIEAKFTSHPSTAVALVTQQTAPAICRKKRGEIYVAMDFDGSGSMADSDPAFERVDAGEAFIDAFFAEVPFAQIGLFDFFDSSPAHTGIGPLVDLNYPNPGFEATRLLWPWSSDVNDLKNALTQLANDGETPMYESLYELMEYIGAGVGQSTPNLSILLLADGQPNGSQKTIDDVIQLSKSAGIPICPVGLGPASEFWPKGWWTSSAQDVMRTLAFETGCVYTSATGAAALEGIFHSLAKALLTGHLVAAFQVNPVPPSGTVVKGEVTVTDASGKTEKALFTFTVP